MRVDNGPEFTSVALDQWAYWHEIQSVLSRPATPTDNAHIESFNARLRRECLDIPIGLSRLRRHAVKSRLGSVHITRNILAARQAI
ncbi:MAG TPA: transposase [Candidatus Latescibacteria bacterium]|nr:transposase [Candidatus Latescibacterota bacterium]